MTRPITREELEEMNLSPSKINEILKKQSQAKDRRYKYIVLLTTTDAEKLAKQTGKEFIRSTEWKSRKKKKG
ncbi:MAG: hypothetical protein AMJ88_16535 [Anaerolineae bacterium SM23_ 63]|nr:MAG: hypothetical protein AMJ88_16535 [Anaerolineae bacterium SM23_ 63]